MKRVLSLVLILVLVLGSFPVYADGHTYGEMLFDMGLVKGDDEGNLNEENTITRAEMMVLLARLYGVEDEAMNFPLESTFTDVDADKWYAPYVAYAQVNGWTKGDGDGTFGPMDLVTADMAATFLLRVLGYDDPADFEFENAVEFAATLGIDVDAMFGNDDAATRGEVFELMYDTLNTETKEGELLGEKLGVMGPVMVEELEVVDITVLNLVEVEVVFNTELDEDSAEDLDFYTIEDHTFEADLQDDGMTVMLTMEDGEEFDNQEEFELEIDGVMSVDEMLTLEDFVSDTLTAFDASIPVALGVELTGPDSFDIMFSEPVWDKEGEFSVEVDNGVYGTIDITFNGDTVSVTMGADLDEGSYEVEVTDAYDYAGFMALNKTFTLEFELDTDAPVAVVDSANETEVVLLFDEDVFFIDDEDDAIPSEDSDLEDYFYHSYSSYTPDLVEIDDEEVTLSFNDNPLPEGTVKIVVDYDANDGTIEDAWGNELEANLVFFVEVVVDDVAPVVTMLETEEVKKDDSDEDLEQYQFAIFFSEALNPDSFDDDNVVVEDDEGDEVDIYKMNYYENEDDEYFVLVYMDDDIEGTYEVTVMGYEDDSLLENEMEEVTLTLVKDDETDPWLSDIEAEFIQDDEDAILYLMFGEDMATEGSYSVLDPENYMIAGYEIDLDDDSIELFGGADTVKIVLADTDLYDYDVVEIARLQDAAGNKSVEMYTTVAMFEVTPPSVQVVTTIDKKHLEIVVDGELSTVKADGFMIENESTSETFASVSFSYDSDDDETTITATLKSDTQITSPGYTPRALYVISDKNKDDKGQYMTTDSVYRYEWNSDYDTYYITDGYAPSFDEDYFEEDYDGEFDGKYVDLPFNEELNRNFDEYDYWAADFVVELNGEELTPFTDFEIEGTGSRDDVYIVYLQINETLEDGDELSVTVEDANYITDRAGNAVEDFEFELDYIEEDVPK